MSKVYLVVTAIGRDRRGTVEKITDVVVQHHANIEESKMARKAERINRGWKPLPHFSF